MLATYVSPTTLEPTGRIAPEPRSRHVALTEGPLTPEARHQVRAALLGGRAVVGYLRQPQGRLSLAQALGAEQADGRDARQLGIDVTTRSGRQVFVALAQAAALLVGRSVARRAPRLSRSLPIWSRLPTAADLGAAADQVVYALGVNAVLPMQARSTWYWTNGAEERPIAQLTAEEAQRAGYRLCARVGLPQAPRAFDPAWIRAYAGLCVGVQRQGVITWRAFVPVDSLAQSLTGRYTTIATAAD